MDIIKLVVSGDTFVPHAPSKSTVMSESEMAAAAEVVHAHSKRMSAHARSADAVKMCVRHGVKVMYHANFLDDEALELLDQPREARRIQNEALAWARYGFGSEGEVRDRAAEILAISPRTRQGAPA